MERTIERRTRANRSTPENVTNISARQLLLAEAARAAEEDATIDAEDVLTEAEEANVLDPVGWALWRTGDHPATWPSARMLP